MSNLTFMEKRKLEKWFQMDSSNWRGQGYVLDFSNQTLAEFVADSTGRDIYDAKYNYASGSKANRLRAFWDQEPNRLVGKLITDLLEYSRPTAGDPARDSLFQECERIAARLVQSAKVERVELITPEGAERNSEVLVANRLLGRGGASGGRVFISYAREDIDYARRMFNELKRESYEPWLDCECLLPGQRWEAEIEQAIRGSRYFIALISSRSSVKRGYVQREISRALDLLEQFPENDVFLIPARLDECEPAHSALRGVQWVDLFPNWESGVNRIIRAFKFGGRTA